MIGCKNLEIVSTRCKLGKEYCQFRLARTTEYPEINIWGMQKLLDSFGECEKAYLYCFAEDSKDLYVNKGRN